MTSRTFRRLGALVAAGLALVLAGCSGGAAAGDDVAPMHRDNIRRMRAEHPDSDFLQSALADYDISDAEVHTGLAEFTTCMADGFGVEAHRNPDGSGSSTAPAGMPAGQASALMEEADAHCGVYAQLGWIQQAMRENPRGLTHAEMVRECFEANNVTYGLEHGPDVFESLLGRGCLMPESDAGRICVVDPQGTWGPDIAELRAWDEARVRDGIHYQDEHNQIGWASFQDWCDPGVS